MKKIILLIIVTVIVGSCEKNDYEYVNLVTPEYLSLKELRSAVVVGVPESVIETGKIYVKDYLVFVNDVDRGIHILNNTDIANPIKVAFLKVPGNKDIAVKGNFLYADSYMDLVVFDISDIAKIKEVKRLENALEYYPVWPTEENLKYNYKPQPEGTILTGYTVTRELKKIEEQDMYTDDVVMEALNNTKSSGTGGSLARFKIVQNLLYTVTSHQIHIFDIESVENPQKVGEISAGFDIETIFNRNQHLFLGSKSGMYIYDISSPKTPTYVSEFQHGTACDPVVVDGDYAYVTLRGGNSCGATESSLLIIDIADITNPRLIKSYPMDEPYGLGVKDNYIFICDGASGLKTYNKKEAQNLKLLSTFTQANAYDVIPLSDRLMMIGKQKLYQYNYTNTGIDLISEYTIQ